MSAACGNLDFKDADPEISTSSPTHCSKGSEHSSYTGFEDGRESDGDDTDYIDQNANEESNEKDFGKSTGSLSPKSVDDEDKDGNPVTVNQPVTPVALIPAIKGSREKHGLSLKKSSVSWAPDVYDPPPSIVSHTRGKKQQLQLKSKSKDNHRKNVKKGHKGSTNSSSRGSNSSKDKKHSSRKHNSDKFSWVTQMPIVAASS